MYPGPTFEVNRDETIHVRWTNQLTDGGGSRLIIFCRTIRASTEPALNSCKLVR